MLLPCEFFFHARKHAQKSLSSGRARVRGYIRDRYLKGSSFQTLIKKRKAISFPKQNLHVRSRLIEKDKNTARGGVHVQFIAHESAKAIEALSHVGEALVEKITLMRR